MPHYLIILGGGYVGLELAQAMRRLGSSVTIVEQYERLANREDEDVSEGLRQLCTDEGIQLVMNAGVSLVEGVSEQSVRLHIEQGDSNSVIEGTDLLVAAGRTPNTDGMGVDLAGIELTDRGHIRSTSDWKQPRPMSGPLANARGVPTSPTSPLATSGSLGTILPAEIV